MLSDRSLILESLGNNNQASEKRSIDRTGMDNECDSES